MYGREPNLQLDNAWVRKMTIGLDYESYRYFLGKTLKETQDVVLENIKKARDRQKKFYDKETKEKCFKTGDFVAIKSPQKNKLDKVYSGPFMVVNDVNVPPNTVKVAEIGKEGKSYLVAMERVKPWVSRSFS